jgi:radical SAM protein with 4Fe4S-binding SPASM domain
MNTLKFAVLELTNRCNLRCVHCASNSGPPRPNEYGTDDWVRIVGDLATLGCEEITLIGGEMQLHPGWETIARAVKAHGIRLVLITNGLLVTDPILEKFIALDPWIIGVSLDGATPGTVQAMRRVDGHDPVMKLLRNLVAAGFSRVNAITTFCKLNFHEFDQLAERFRGSKITWQVQVANPSGERFSNDWSLSVDDFAVFCEKVTHHLEHDPDLWLCPMDDFGYHPLSNHLSLYHSKFPGCMAGLVVIGLRSDGAVLPCLSLGEEFICGNLHEATLAELWADDARFEKFRNKRKYLTGACDVCAFAEACRGGCTAMAASNTGAFGENAYCLREIERKRLLTEMLQEK